MCACGALDPASYPNTYKQGYRAPKECNRVQETKEGAADGAVDTESPRARLLAFLSLWRANMALRDPSANGIPLNLMFNAREVALVETIAYMSDRNR